MKTNKLLSTYKLGDIELKNHIAMAPMTRSRAIGNIPNELMETYYKQRAHAGLIITEGTSPSPNGLGYSRIPGIFNQAQIVGWSKVTKAVHTEGGKIFIQLMHTGRVGHKLNLPEGATLIAPSSITSKGKMWTDAEGMLDMSDPKEMSPEEIIVTKNEYIKASVHAVEAGFDGVELHGANGYLLEQFLSPVSNQRQDNYGGSIENRLRFVLEVVEGVANAIGKNKVGIRLSPYGASNDMLPYPEVDETYDYLSKELNKIGIAYIHVVDHSAMGAPPVPQAIKQTIRNNFKNTLILAGGFNQTSAEQELQTGIGDMIAFGKPFITNPDLIDRLLNDWPLKTDYNFATFYSADAIGYTDYTPFSKDATPQ